VTFARLHTFGKALGCHGAIVLGSPALCSYLVNYARPLIYSTSLPLHTLVSIQCAYNLLENDQTVKFLAIPSNSSMLLPSTP